MKSPPFRRIDSGDATSTSDESETEYEEGTVSGYAVQHATPSGFVRPRPDDQQNEPQYAVNENNNNHKPPDQPYAQHNYQPETQYIQHYPQSPPPIHNYQPEPQYINYQHEQDAAASPPSLQTQTIAGNKAGFVSFARAL